MRLYILLFVFFIISLNAQESFKIESNGMTDYIVTSTEGKKQTQLYNQTLKWIKETYKSPNDVIQMTIENKKIRFSGFKAKFNCSKSGKIEVCSDGIYTIEVSFKDGKYKFDPIEVTLMIGLNKITHDLNSFPSFFDKKGNLNEKYRQNKENIENFFNSLNQNLKDYIITDGKSIQKEW